MANATVREQPQESSLTSLHKAVALLEALTDLGGQGGVSELARRVDVPKSTAHRLLAVLLERGLVERRGTDYRLGLRLFEFGAAASAVPSLNLRDRCLPYLEALYEQTHETVNLGILDGADVLYVEKIYGHGSVRTPSKVGGRLPATCVALGTAMLAHSSPDLVRDIASRPLARMTPKSPTTPARLVAALRDVRETGVAYDVEQAQLGLACVAAPVFDPSGRVAAAISVSGATHRFDPRRVAAAVSRTAAAITTQVMPLLDPGSRPATSRRVVRPAGLATPA